MSNLLVNALIFIIKFIIVASSSILREKACHLVLIKVHFTKIGVRIFIVFIEFTALAACHSLRSVFGKVHISSELSEHRHENKYRDNYSGYSGYCRIELYLNLAHFLIEFARRLLGILGLLL